MDRYAVFGNPIGHSKSPLIHRWFAEQTAQDLQYEAILAPVDGFADSWQDFVRAGGKGANVTVPFKEVAFALAEVISERAQQAGAVNTLYVSSNGQLCGDNTDGVGLIADLERLGVTLAGTRVLLLGAGGASRGVVGPLLEAGAAQVHIANRTADKATTVAALFNGQVTASGFNDIPMLNWQIVINATSSGLSQQRPDIDASHLQSCELAYDMMYGKEPTAFLNWSQQHGVPICADGIGMLVAQAAESFQLWRGVKPELAPVLEKVTALVRL
ncbi:MAG: shikimate dehydrogenase [Rheinheimera sp.]